MKAKLFTFFAALLFATTSWAQDTVTWDSVFVDKVRAWRDGDGQLIIKANGKIYNAAGVPVDTKR